MRRTMYAIHDVVINFPVLHTSIRIINLFATAHKRKFASIAEDAPTEKTEVLARP